MILAKIGVFITVGIDIIYVPRLKKLAESALERIFLDSELSDSRPEHLAGIWAAKEAFFKALGRKVDWLAVWIEHDTDGKPKLQSTLLRPNQRAEVSISHDGDYAVAEVILYGSEE